MSFYVISIHLCMTENLITSMYINYDYYRICVLIKLIMILHCEMTHVPEKPLYFESVLVRELN